MKKLKVLFVFLSCIVLLTGCDPPYYAGDKRLTNCVIFDAPSVDLTHGITEELEKDEYGRILFRYDMGEYGNNFLGVCQGYTKDTTAFYQDFCTVRHADGSKQYSEEEIRKLKEQNDWGKPLEPSRMTVIDFKNQENLRYGLGKVKIEEKYDIGEIIDSGEAYMDGDENQLYWIRANKDGKESFYFMILDKDFTLREDGAIEEMDWLNFQPQLHEFKERYGWDFTTGRSAYQ